MGMRFRCTSSKNSIKSLLLLFSNHWSEQCQYTILDILKIMGSNDFA